MSEKDGLVLLLLIIASLMGYVLGRINRKGWSYLFRAGPMVLLPSRHYIEGINQLLNEQPDTALDAFIASFDVNSDTLETHIALGAMLRNRGEAGRAIRIHQNLLARPNLPAEQQELVQIELALDFMRSGLYDRAESIFVKLSGSGINTTRVTTLEKLVEIYQGQSEWQQALSAAERLCAHSGSNRIPHWRGLQSHFCCELALLDMTQNDYTSAGVWLEKALKYNPKAYRPTLLRATLLLNKTHESDARKILKALMSSDPAAIGQALPILMSASTDPDSLSSTRTFLENLYASVLSEVLLPEVTLAVEQAKGTVAAVEFLSQELKRVSLHEFAAALLAKLVHVNTQNDGAGLDLEHIIELLEAYLRLSNRYLCDKCGFSGHQHHWQCPTCKSWESIHMASLFDTVSQPD